MLTRQYRTDETPALGDVVQICGGPYGSSVVTQIKGEWAVCERVHASVGASGQIQIGVERVEVTTNKLREMPVFVTGPSGEIDNRVRGV
jgi:hypothetical protein